MDKVSSISGFASREHLPDVSWQCRVLIGEVARGWRSHRPGGRGQLLEAQWGRPVRREAAASRIAWAAAGEQGAGAGERRRAGRTPGRLPGCAPPRPAVPAAPAP